jgi:trk/ktr system potassium uptake protein
VIGSRRKRKLLQVSRHVAPVDLRTVLAQLRRPLRFLAWALVAPFVVALFSSEWAEALVLGAVALVTYVAGGERKSAELAPRDALVFAALVYLFFAFLGALVYLPATGFVDGFFEAMSGFTTTGLSVLPLDDTPRSLLFFRAYSQWIGGAGIIVLSIVFLPGSRRALLPLYAAEGRGENLLGNIVSTTRLVFGIYGALTLLAYVTFVLCGMGAFDACLHVFATLSTGGFSPYADSIGHYRSVPITVAVSVFMLVGAVALPLYYRAGRDGARRFFADAQLQALVVLALAGFLLTAFYGTTGGSYRSLIEPAFHSISALTTTGFNVTDTSSWPQGGRLVAMVLMMVGGSVGSTAGGLKLLRVLVLARVGQWYVRRALLPAEAQLPVRLAGRILHDEEVRGVAGLGLLYLGLIATSAFLLAFTGCAPMDALFEATSAVGTVGLSSGLTSPELASWAKLLLAFDMWAGRLEILPLLVLLYPPQWKSSWRPS